MSFEITQSFHEVLTSLDEFLAFPFKDKIEYSITIELPAGRSWSGETLALFDELSVHVRWEESKVVSQRDPLL